LPSALPPLLLRRDKLHAAGGGPEAALPAKVCIIAGKGKSKEGPASHSVIKESVAALLRSMGAPFKDSPDSTPHIGRLEATGPQVAEWLATDGPALLSTIIPTAAAAAASAAVADAAAAAAGSSSLAAAAGGAPGEMPPGGAPEAAAGADGLARVSSSSGGSPRRCSQDVEAELQVEISTEAR
jgi:hypothetical protein